MEPMTQRFPLLYDTFEMLFRKNPDLLSDSIAIWHVLDPRQLIRSVPSSKPNEPHLSTEKNHIESEDTACSFRSIRFGELREAVNRLSHRIAQELLQDADVAAILTQSGDLSRKTKDPSDSGESMVRRQAIHSQTHTVVAIFMPPGIDRIITQIACMKLRLPFLPLDRQLSVGRIVQILEHISPRMVILSRGYHDLIFTATGDSPPYHTSPQSCGGISTVVHTETSIPETAGTFFTGKLGLLKFALRSCRVCTYEDLVTDVWNSVDPSSHAMEPRMNGLSTSSDLPECFYGQVMNPVIVVLFTSGSTTDRPKTVRLYNHQLVNRLQWQWSMIQRLATQNCCSQNNPSLTNTEVVLASTACVFVDAFNELFSALFAGIPVVVPGGPDCASEVCVSDVRILFNLIQRFNITRITTVPVQLKIWMDQARLIHPKDRQEDFKSLTTLVVSGDILLPQLASSFFRLAIGSHVRLMNFYGTTEVAGDVTAAVFYNEEDVTRATKHLETLCEEDSLAEAASFVTVGVPIDNTAVYIVRKRPVEDVNRVVVHQPDHSIPVEHCVLNESLHESESSIAVIGSPLYPVNWHELGYTICEKGCIGEVAITGLAVTNESIKMNQSPAESTVFMDSDQFEDMDALRLNHPEVNFPGDLGFICPRDNLLYICGRSDELVKINAVGFLASDVDRLLLHLSDMSVRNPHQMSPIEMKLTHISETVTLPIQHPVNPSKQLVCFYVVSVRPRIDCVNPPPIDLHPTASLEQPNSEGRLDFHTPLHIIDPQSIECNRVGPKPNELSVVIAHYLPVYIRPIFVLINHMPVMPTSGKIDKQRLRSLYARTFATERNDESQPTRFRNDSAEAGNGDHNSSDVQDSECQGVDCSEPPSTLSRRDQARRVLAGVLGLQAGSLRPHDDEDFYLLGGNSLMAVLALENLRQLGFKVHLETFYQTSSIGYILDSLNAEGDVADCNWAVFNATSLKSNGIITCAQPDLPPQRIPADHEFTASQCFEKIYVTEWTEQIASAKSGLNEPQLTPSREDIIKLLVDTFERKDPITHVFQLNRSDLETAARTYFNPQGGSGIVLTATCHAPDSGSGEQLCDFSEPQLVGALLSMPADQLSELPCADNPRLSRLQKYFDFCSQADQKSSFPLEEVRRGPTLAVIMAGVLVPVSDQLKQNCPSVRARWNRIALEILAGLESQLLKVAMEKHYEFVETLNTCETTKEVCTDLGYDLLNSARMEAYALAENFDLNPSFREHQSYYMIKRLCT